MLPRQTSESQSGRAAHRVKSASAQIGKTSKPIAIYHEHPRWFEPVFAEMDRRGVPYVRLDAARHHFDVSPNGAPAVRLDLQSHEPFGMDSRQRPRDFLHAQLSRAPGTHGRPRRKWQPRISQRDFKGAAAVAARIARASLSALGRDQPSSASCRRGARNALPDRNQAKYRRQRRGHRALRFARTD